MRSNKTLVIRFCNYTSRANHQPKRMTMKQPDECMNMQEIRAEIDRINRQIIAALGERFAYVKAATPFKTDVNSVQAPERLKQMLQERREWASSAGLDQMRTDKSAQAIAQFYEALIHHFIAAEIQHWQSTTQAKQNGIDP
jgi:isochorismate pyruvate lyase